MCGIVGLVQDRSGPFPRDTLARMNSLLVHRGPDDEGVWVQGGVGLAQRRLSIIDLETGHQPLSNEDGSLWIVYNGEVYNYLELRETLVQQGHRFRTRSDTEVIVHLYEEKGPGCLQDLRGMFAFAIWDQRDRSLFLARDRIGKKPLFFVHLPQAFLFASEIKSLLAHPEVRREVDHASLMEYLSFRYVPAPRTLFRGVQKLEPGHYLIHRDGQIRQSRYWDVFQEDSGQAMGPRQHAECVEELDRLLRESIRLRLRSDVPLGAFLSGGVDSSAVVGLMSGMVERPVQTFSVGFQDPAYNERPFARAVAKLFGTEHREILLEPGDIPETLPDLIWYRDAPVSESSDVALFSVSRLARQSVKVVLSGEGGDELFGGYAKYRVDLLASIYQRLPRFLEEALVGWPLKHLPIFPRKLRIALRSLRIRDETERFVSYFASLDLSERRQILSREFLEAAEAETTVDIYAAHLAGLAQRTPMDRMFYGDLRFWLPDNLLERADRITMATSLEGRMPLLDHKLVEFASRIPARWKRSLFDTKLILKHTLHKLLPRKILYRPKVGFTVPVRDWFRGELKGWLQEILHSPEFRKRGIFHVPHVEVLLRQHLEGRQDCSKHLWMLVNLELWFRQIDNPPRMEPALRSGLPAG